MSTMVVGIHYPLPYGQSKRDLVSREYNYNTGKLFPTIFNISLTNKIFTSQLHSAQVICTDEQDRFCKFMSFPKIGSTVPTFVYSFFLKSCLYYI